MKVRVYIKHYWIEKRYVDVTVEPNDTIENIASKAADGIPIGCATTEESDEWYKMEILPEPEKLML